MVRLAIVRGEARIPEKTGGAGWKDGEKSSVEELVIFTERKENREPPEVLQLDCWLSTQIALKELALGRANFGSKKRGINNSITWSFQADENPNWLRFANAE